METGQDPKLQNLLGDLCSLLQNPELPGLLDHLTHLDSNPALKDPVTPVPAKKPSLLQRLGVSEHSKNLKRSRSPIEEERPPKRRRSPQFSASSGRTLMSRLLNHREKLPSTLTSPKSLLSLPLATTQEDLNHLGLDPMFSKELRLLRSPSQRHVSQETPRNLSQTTRKASPPRSSGFWSQTCPGTEKQMNLPPSIATPVARKPVGFCEPTTGTSQRLNSSLKSPQTRQLVSLRPSGNESSKEKQSTSTRSSRHSTMLSLMKRERAAWETRKYLLGSLNPGNGSRLLLNGPQLGGELPRPSDSPSLIAVKNSSNTAITLNPNSRLRSLPHTTNSSSTTSPYATKSQLGNTRCSRTTIDSLASIPPSSCLMGLKVTPTKVPERSLPSPTQVGANRTFATSSMRVPAKTQTRNASTATSARTATSPDTEQRNVRPKENSVHGLLPKYLRHNLWEESSTLSPTTAEWSETARPLPRPPPDEVLNPIVFKTITDNADLFQVHTPIKVDVFEALLKNHPNQPFVQSVCAGLRDGFWPWADTLRGDLPVTHDESCPTPSDDRQASFIRDQCLKERWSRPICPRKAQSESRRREASQKMIPSPRKRPHEDRTATGGI